METTQATATANETPAPAPQTARMIGVCKKCKKVHRVEGEWKRPSEQDRKRFPYLKKVAHVGTTQVDFWNGGWQCSRPCECGSKNNVLLQKVRAAAVTTHECGARCIHAKGHLCECSCGGKNHGKGG